MVKSVVGGSKKPTTHGKGTYKRTGARKTAPARASTPFAAQFFPDPVPSRWEQRGYLAKKVRDGSPVYERMEKCLEWLKEKFKIVFVPRAELTDPDDMECLGVTQAAISDFTLDAWIYSIFAGVSELPFLPYPFSTKTSAAGMAEGEHKDRFLDAVEGIKVYFYATKREMKKRVENDAYFLNSQFRSHTIWFLEKFFATDLEAPEMEQDFKVEFEVIMPEPLPEDVQRAIQDK